MKTMMFHLEGIACAGDDYDKEATEREVLDKIKAVLQAIKEGVLEFDDAIRLDREEQAKYVCPKCGKELCISSSGLYDLVCEDCEEDFFIFECDEE